MRLIKLMGVVCFAICVFSSCKKDYYEDTGTHKADFNGTVMQYLEANPTYFDTLVQVIKLSGMESTFTTDTITFFAPNNVCIRNSVLTYNAYLKLLGKDTVSQLSQIKQEVWKDILSLYVFKGARKLESYFQIDTLALSSYPGQSYISYQGRSMNIGVIYNDAGGVKYAGYRQLMISYIPDLTTPRDYWIKTLVSSCNIKPKNGVVHVLRYSHPSHYFGFDISRFINRAEGI